MVQTEQPQGQDNCLKCSELEQQLETLIHEKMQLLCQFDERLDETRALNDRLEHFRDENDYLRS